MKTYVLTFMASFTLMACALGPHYERPPTGLETYNFMHVADGVSDVSLDRWWDNIDDALLSAYVDQLMEQNLDLLAAGERVVQARNRARIASGDYYPGLGVQGSGGRSFSPVTSVFTNQSSRQYQTSYAADLSASWEIDLFGRVQNSVASAKAGYEASRYDHMALAHSLIAELLNNRVAIAVYKAQFDLAEKIVHNRQLAYNLVKRRYDKGVEGIVVTDLHKAEQALNAAMVDVSGFEQALYEQLYRLDVLLGQLPGTTGALTNPFPLMAQPVAVPACLPLDLLDRRPDLLASEFRLMAANADIGVALADIYPNITLSGLIGFTGAGTSNLFSSDQLAGSFLGSITSRIFEGGALRANIDLQESEAKELAFQYSHAVLEAVREVETALKADQELDKQVRNSQKSVQALKQEEKSVQRRYDKGVADLQELLDVQQRLYVQEQSLLQAQQEKWRVRTALILAMGGDWANADNQIMNQCGDIKDE